MNFALVYLVHQFLYRFVEFLRHWYIDGPKTITHGFVSLLHNMDRTFAVRITIKHFFEPLYGDYSLVGRFWGILFRSLRAAVGGVLYLVLGIVFLGVFLVWLAIPPAIIFYATKHY